MEAQLQRPTHDPEEDPRNNAGLHSVMGGTEGGEHDHHGEKKSVMKKVKEKAKKIKDTIKKHGGGHEHDHRHEGEDDEEEDEETVNAPDVHGAPMYGSAFISGTSLPTQTDLNLEKPTGPPEIGYNPNVKNEVHPDFGDDRGMSRTSGLQEDRYNRPNVRNEVYPDVGHGILPEDRCNPNPANEMHPDGGDGHGVMTKTRGRPEDTYNPNTDTGYAVTKTSGLQGDQYNPDTKDEVYPNVGDGGAIRTSGLGEMVTELGRSSVEAPQPESKTPLLTGRQAVHSEEAIEAEPTVKTGPLVDLEEDPHSPKNRPGGIPPSNYQAKVIDPTGEGGREAEVAPLVRRLDNLHVHDKSESNAGSELTSYTGSHDQFAPQSAPTDDRFNPESNQGGASKNPELPKSFDPAHPESMPRDTIAGKISSATSVIADKAVYAKNVVASKLGYGNQDRGGQDSSKGAAAESATGYGHKVAEKLAPVYEKVAGAGSAMISKVQGGGAAGHEGGDPAATDTDKGVSVKEYLAEKFSPGDEDKALSEAITDAIRKKREGIWREQQPMGQVKESEDVGACLGTGKESERNASAAGSENSGTGVVDRVKGAVSSWLGMSRGTQTAQHSVGQEYGPAPSGGGRTSEEEVSGLQRPNN